MSKSSPRLGRPGSAGSQSTSMRKELQGNRSCMLRIGERLMRAGSEGNLVQRVQPAQSQTSPSSSGLRQGSGERAPSTALQDTVEYSGTTSTRDPGNSSSSTVMDCTKEPVLQKKNHNANVLFGNPSFAPRSSSTLPRSSASSAAGARDSQSDTLMKIKDVERKKEVLLDILKQKYPHHAAIIMGHQPGSPWLSDCPPSAGGLVLKEHQDPAETMSDGDLPSPSAPFTRGCKSRASLPVGRSGGHAGERPRGVLYLQYGEETKQVRMPPELCSQDALHALFITAFPHQLTMKMLQSPNVVIYIKDTSRNFYYELDDIRNISPHSCLKVYHKDPAHIFNRHARPAKTEGRISKEILYGSHSPIHSRSSSGRSTLQNLQGSMSPPMVRSMPSSPSRRVYGGGSTGVVAGDLGSSTLPRERLSGAGLSRSLCTNSSSSILERRDVKPDEDADNIKSMALVLRGEGSSHYPDSYSSSLQDGGGLGGRISISSSQCSAPPSLTSDILDSLGTGITGGLQQFRASVKPLMGYGDALDQQTRSLHRQKSRKYGESQLPPLGTRTPPSSPQRVNEVRLAEGQIIGGVGLVSGDRMSPIRRSLRRESNGTTEVVNKSRGSGSTSSPSSVFFDSPLGTPDRLFQGHVTASAVQSERMKAMEDQIASLAGLVHHALSVGVDIPGMKDAVSESSGQKLLSSRHGVSPDHQKAAALIDSFKAPPLALQAPPPDSELQQSLMLAKRNVSELRAQLKQLRHQQLLNQQSVNSMLQMAGQELLLLMCDRVNQSEEAAFRRRAEMEEERMLYMRTEEAILNQLSELEVYVDHLQRSSASSPGQLTITLRDVEEAAVNLRRVGEALSVLKSEFPELQVKLRSVLRLEVEAVRFLKEEPHKMDVMLRRVRSLTEALSSLRRSVSESSPPTKPGPEEAPLKEAEQGLLKSSPKPQPRSSVKQAPPPSEGCLDGSASPLMVRRMKSAAATGVQPPHHHHPSPPLTPTHGRDSPTVAKVSPRSREGSPALQRKPGPGPGPGQENSKDQANLKPKHTETAQRQPPEGGVTTETSSSNQSATRSGPSQSSSTDPQSSSSKDKTSGRGPSESEQSAPKNKPDEASEKQEVRGHRLSGDAGSPHNPPAPADSAPAPSSAPTSSERSSRPLVEKPRRSSVERELKQSPDRAGRSPPPPPPRRFPSVSSSVSRASSEEEKLTRREPLGAQDEDDKDKKPSVAPQPKPPRQPPEVKPKPILAAPPPSPPAAASSHREEVQEEKEGKKVTKELLVTTKLSDKNRFSKKNKKWKEVSKTPAAAAEVIPQHPSDLQVAPQVSGSQSCTHREGNAERHREEPQRREELEQQEATPEEVWVLRSDASQSPQTVQTKKKDEIQTSTAPQEVKTVQRGEEGQSQRTATPTGRLTEDSSSQNQVSGLLKEAPSPGAPPEVQTGQPRAKPEELTPADQQKEKVPGQVCSPTTGEKKVKYTTIVTLQRDVSRAGAEQTKEKAARDTPAEKKSNVMVVLTLQKENTADDGSVGGSPQEQQEEQRSPEPSPVLKRYPPSPDLTVTAQQRQEDAEQRSRERSQYSEDGGTLSPDTCDDEGPPPPPPPTGKISLRFSKSRAWAPPKEEDQNKTGESVDSSGETTYLGHGNQGFEDGDLNKPIIFILNEPMDFEYAYKRLSTIFESEEDLERILSSENLLVEEEMQGQDQTVRKINISDLNSCLKDITGNGHHHKPPADKDSTPENQEKSPPDPLKKNENKKKFKFKFPKNKLAAISQALRSGSTKAGKKTLEVVVYEEVEETGTVTETIKQTKESVVNTKQSHESGNSKCDRDIKDSTPVHTTNSKSQSRVEELRKGALDSMDSLEQSIKLLEISVDSITAPSPPQSPDSPSKSSERSASKGKVRRERERSPSKRPAPQVLKGPNPPQSKRAKAHPPPETGKASTKKQTSTSSSSAQRLHTKSRHSPSSGSEKTSKNQPANQKQPSQADSSSGRAAGSSTCSVALRASKIPGLCHNSGKLPPASSSSAPHCSDSIDSLRNLSSCSSSASSSPAPSVCSSEISSSLSSAPSSSSGQQALLFPVSSSSVMKHPPSASPPSSLLSSPPPPQKSLIPSLTLCRLLPSSSHMLSPSHANLGPAHHRPRTTSTGQQRLVLASTSQQQQQRYCSSSSYSSSSSSPSSSSTSLSPTSSSSSPPSPSASLHPSVMSRRGWTSGSEAPCKGRGRTRTAAAASKDAS